MQHCLDQTIQFSEMLNGTTKPDRSHDILVGQLGYNLGGFARLHTRCDERALWQQLEHCIIAGDYSPMIKWARRQSELTVLLNEFRQASQSLEDDIMNGRSDDI